MYGGRGAGGLYAGSEFYSSVVARVINGCYNSCGIERHRDSVMVGGGGL